MEGKKRKKEKPLIHRNLRCDSEVKKTKKKQTKKRYCYVETRATVNVSTTTTMKKKNASDLVTLAMELPSATSRKKSLVPPITQNTMKKEKKKRK